MWDVDKGIRYQNVYPSYKDKIHKDKILSKKIAQISCQYVGTSML